MRCKLISNDSEIVADGDGSSKKLAKQNACSLMLTKLESVGKCYIFRLYRIFCVVFAWYLVSLFSVFFTRCRFLEASPLFIATSIYKSQRRVTVPKELKRKTISKVLSLFCDGKFVQELGRHSRQVC